MSCKIYLFGEKKSEKKKKWREKKNEYVVRKMEGKKTLWGHNNFIGTRSSLFRNLFRSEERRVGKECSS